MDPMQELFAKLISDLEALGYDVYHGSLPADGAQYPYVYLGESRQKDDASKLAVFGSVYQTIHVYSNAPGDREPVSAMLMAVKGICRKLANTANFTWYLRNLEQTIVMENNTTTEPLLHGILEAEYKFS